MAGWSELYTDNDSLTMLKVAANADGRLEVFGVNGQGHIWHTWQTAPNGGWAGHWTELYTNNDSLVMLDVARNADGRLEVFGVNGQGHIWHTWQTAPNGGWAGHWSELYTDNDSLKMLKVAANADGRLEVFGVNAQGHIWHTWQTAPNGGWAGSWSELYTDNDNLVMLDVGRNADGRLEVFGVNGQGHIWHTWQVAANGGWAGSWAELYTDSDDLVGLNVASDQDGRLEVFGVNAQGHIWHTWQVAPNGAWVGDTDYLHLAEQYQVESEWCWSATTVSITHYYDPASTWTQCSLVNKAFNQTTCCQDGSSDACNQPWYPDQALTITGHLASTANGKPSFQTIMSEINEGHPVSIGIYWTGGGGHNPAVDGYADDPEMPTIDLQDPIYGPTTQDFNSFPSSYQGGATWGESYFTK
jgi:Tectonin domain/Papain-like cysteine protease AvrRpt2